ncbi:hypothetical protein ACFO5K_04095 [Nocardia halotolerans]|uniref:Uncharacterized protein n=1 Tax=Nocardia halotolerans TaxID=1755878 RepID=A0ABV8VBI0_9NOCA
MTGHEATDLTITDLEQLRKVTLDTYLGADESAYHTLSAHLQAIAAGDGGLINMIDLAILRTRQLEALRAQVQQDYAAIHTKQQRDAAQIRDLEDLVHEYHKALMDVTGGDQEATATKGGVDYTIVAPGALAKMLADGESTMSPRFREAIARARQRRENPDG